MSLKLINIDHAYGKRPALADVNLEIREGDCYGFIGHNGAGKSTAMRIALGLIRPQRGRAAVAGTDARGGPAPPQKPVSCGSSRSERKPGVTD